MFGLCIPHFSAAFSHRRCNPRQCCVCFILVMALKNLRSGSQASPLAKRSPAANKKALGNDIMAQANKDALEELANLLREQPCQILPVLQLVRSGRVPTAVQAQVKGESVEDGAWPATYIRLVKLPKYWRLAVMTKIFGEADINLEQVDGDYPTFVQELFVFMTGISEAWHFPLA